MATRVLELLFHGRDTGVSATINEIRGNLTNLGRTSSDVNRRMSRETGLLQRQWQALGTTWRYAIAGLAIAKIYQAIQAYKDFNQQLGYLNNTLNETAGRSQASASQIDSLGRQAAKISTSYIQPLSDVMQSFVNIAQSIPGVPQRLIPKYGAVEAKGALVSGIDPRLLGSTALGLGTAFYGRAPFVGNQGPQRIEQVTAQLIRAGRVMPRTTFEELANYLPQLARGAVAGGFSLPEALGMLTLEQRAGGRVSTNVLWLRQMMTRLRNPAKGAQKAYAPAFGGLTGTPLLNELNSMTGMQVFRTLVGHAFQQPGGPASAQQVAHAFGLKPRPGQTFEDVVQQQGLQGLHLTGPALTFLQQTIGGRMQSLFAALGVIQNIGQLNTEVDGFKNSLQDMNKQADIMRQRMPLQEMSNAFSNATTVLFTEFNPALGLVAGGLTDVAKFIQNDVAPAFHRGRQAMGTAENAVSGALGLPHVGKGRTAQAINELLLAAVGIGAVRSLRGGMLGRVLGGIPGLGRLGGRKPLDALLDVQAVQSAAAGIANGTYQSPFWVVIHPLSKNFIGDPFGYKPNDPKKSVEGKVLTEAEKAAEKAGGGAAAASGWRAITGGLLRRAGTGTAAILGSRAGMGALRVGGPVAATAGFLALPDDLTNDLGPNSPNRFKYPYLFQAARGRIASQAIPQDRRQNFRMLQNSIIEEFRRRHLNSRQADEALHKAVQDFLNPNFSARAAQAHQQAQQIIHRNRVSQDVSKNVARRRVSPGVSQAVIQAIRAGDVAGAGLGVLVPDTYSGAVDVHLTLDPAQGLDKILKPTQSVVHVSPTKFWRNNQPPPTSRGKQKSARKVR